MGIKAILRAIYGTDEGTRIEGCRDRRINSLLGQVETSIEKMDRAGKDSARAMTIDEALEQIARDLG